MPFGENLRNELDYQGLIVKQLSQKTGINIHTLNHYLSGKKSMPPADAAVKIAAALGVSVEYLVTGKEKETPSYVSCFKFRKVIDNLQLLSEDVRIPILAMIETAVEQVKKNSSL